MQREASERRNPFSLNFWRTRDLSRLRPLLDLLPLVGEVLVNTFNYFFYRPQRLVLRPYSNLRTWQHRLFGLAIVPTVFVFCFVWGFFFALTAPYLIVPCAIPVVVLGLLTIWALPEERVAPLRLMRFLHAGFIISLILWPNYLAIALPGLPWMTFLRIFGIPLTLALLMSLSASQAFRAKLGMILNSMPLVWRCLAVFAAMMFITLPFSKSIGSSFSRTLIYQVNWIGVFMFSAYMFYKPGRVVRYIILLCALAVPIGVISFMEFEAQHLLWDSHVPFFLKVDDLDHLLRPEFRTGTGEYRAKATFSTALGLAEYVAVLTPFLLHWLVTSRVLLVRAVCVAMIVLILLTIDFSGSRLGNVGVMLSVLLYSLYWAYMRWRTERSDLLAPAIFFSYPAFFVLLMGASLFVTKVHNAIWGGGAQASSNAARTNQIHMALPHIFENPIGHGTGMSGPAMGYGEGRFVTIDNYMISLGLDYGPIGVLAYYGMFLIAAGVALRAAVFDVPESRDPEAAYLAPLAMSVVTWMVIKLVFSQIDNDPLLWMETGMLVALYARVQNEIRTSRDRPAPRGYAANAA